MSERFWGSPQESDKVPNWREFGRCVLCAVFPLEPTRKRDFWREGSRKIGTHCMVHDPDGPGAYEL